MSSRDINMGDFDQLVKVQSCTITTGSQGAKKYTFTDHLDVWAKVESNAQEMSNNSNWEESQYITITCYKIPNITTRWRIKVNGMPYEITSIDTIERISPYCIINLKAIDK